MTYFQVSGDPKSGYNVWYRNDTEKFPFITTLYGTAYRGRSVKTWKTESGAIEHIKKNFPEWIFETNKEYHARKADYKLKKIT